MAASLQVVQGIENNIEGSKPILIELAVLDIGMVGLELCIWLELVRDFFCDLSMEGNITVSISGQCRGTGFVDIRTRDLDFLICSTLKRNWRFRLLRSIVSRSMM